MAIDEKKATAITAAVFTYLEAEEHAFCMAAAAPAEEKPVAPPAEIRVWGISGRQAQMQLRTLMQLKTFHSTRSRGF